MTTFEKILNFTLTFEGGYADDPKDLGGKTNAGVTQTTYDKYRSAKKLPLQSVVKLSRAELNEIYFNGYWLASHCDKMPEPIAGAVFDTAVMRGALKAVAMLQKRLNLKADGIVGSATIATLLNLTREQADAVAVGLANDRAAFHKWRCTVNPTQFRFLKGWLRRCDSLAKFVVTL